MEVSINPSQHWLSSQLWSGHAATAGSCAKTASTLGLMKRLVHWLDSQLNKRKLGCMRQLLATLARVIFRARVVNGAILAADCSASWIKTLMTMCCEHREICRYWYFKPHASGRWRTNIMNGRVGQRLQPTPHPPSEAVHESNHEAYIVWTQLEASGWCWEAWHSMNNNIQY